MYKRFETARVATQTRFIKLNFRTHFLKFSRVPKSVFIDSFMHNRHPMGLRHEEDPWLLPIGHKTRMNVGLDREWLERVLIKKANSATDDIEVCSRPPDIVQKRHHRRLHGVFDKNI